MDKKNLKLWFCTCFICTQLVHTDLSPSFKINPAYHACKDINAFAITPLNLSNPLIFGIVKYAKVTEVNR